MATPIFQIIGKHVGPTKLLEVDLFNIKYDSEGRLNKRYISTNLDNMKSKIEKAIATTDNNKDNNKEDP